MPGAVGPLPVRAGSVGPLQVRAGLLFHQGSPGREAGPRRAHLCFHGSRAPPGVAGSRVPSKEGTVRAERRVIQEGKGGFARGEQKADQPFEKAS